VRIAPKPGSATFAALEDLRYRKLWIGGVLSFLSVQMQMIARGWLALELGGSNKALGVVYLGFGVPMLLLSPLGGVAADRFAKRRVIMGCQLILAASGAFVCIALLFDALTFWMLVLSSVGQAVGFAFLGPSRMAFTAELVGVRRLGNAIVLQQMSMNGTRVFGPALAGVLVGVAYFGPAGVYAVTTALMFGAMAYTRALPEGRALDTGHVRAPLADLADGLRYVRQHRLVLIMLISSFAVLMLGFPYMAFLPTLAEDEFEMGASGYGIMSGVTAIGALAASLFIASRADGPSAPRLQLIAGLAFGVSVIFTGMSPSFGVAVIFLLMAGAASSAYQSLNNALILGSSDPTYHGRLQSLMMLGFSGFGLAALPLGALADAIGIRTTFAGMGVAVVLVMVLYGLAQTGRRDPEGNVAVARA